MIRAVAHGRGEPGNRGSFWGLIPLLSQDHSSRASDLKAFNVALLVFSSQVFEGVHLSFRHRGPNFSVHGDSRDEFHGFTIKLLRCLGSSFRQSDVVIAIHHFEYQERSHQRL